MLRLCKSASDGGSSRAFAPPMPVKGRTPALWFWWKKIRPTSWHGESIESPIFPRVSYISIGTCFSWSLLWIVGTVMRVADGRDQRWKPVQPVANVHKECPWWCSEFVWIFIVCSYGFLVCTFCARTWQNMCPFTAAPAKGIMGLDAWARKAEEVRDICTQIMAPSLFWNFHSQTSLLLNVGWALEVGTALKARKKEGEKEEKVRKSIQGPFSETLYMPNAMMRKWWIWKKKRCFFRCFEPI